MLFGAAAYAECSGLRTATSQVSYLPLTHVVQRACSLYLAAYTTAHTHLCADPQRLLEHLRTARPQLFFAVPRIWEKLAAGLRALRAAGHHDAAALTAVGLDHCDDAVTGAAGLANEVFDELRSFGLPLVTAYGLTETAGAVTRDDPAHPAPDTVGRAEPGVEVRVAHDGEVLLRGPTVMRGYLGRPAETAAVLDPGGWLHTGDLGKIRRDGRLTIVGRKKEIIVTSGGKNIMPTAVEMLLTRHPLIGQALVCGDGHPYLVALLTLDPDADRPADVDATLAKAVAEANAQLSRPEQVKRWMVLNQPWTIEQGAITPTLKLRRTVLTEQHADDIASLYDCQRLSAEGHSSWSGSRPLKTISPLPSAEFCRPANVICARENTRHELNLILWQQARRELVAQLLDLPVDQVTPRSSSGEPPIRAATAEARGPAPRWHREAQPRSPPLEA